MDDTNNSQILEKLQYLSEYELTEQILTPLFKAFGYTRVEYHGSAHDEEGKDLVCWRTNEIGEVELTVVQVKKFKLSRRAVDPHSFSEIITQLSQAAEKKLPHLDGSKHLPEIIYFITPFPLSTRILNSRFEGFQALRSRRVRILDGPRIVNLMQNHLPSLFYQFASTRARLSKIVRPQLTNEILLNALDFPNQRGVETFYTSLDFAIGRPSTQFFFRASFSPISQAITIGLDAWKRISDINARSRAILAHGFIREDERTDARLAQALAEKERWEKKRQPLASRYDQLKMQYDKLKLAWDTQTRISRNSDTLETEISEQEMEIAWRDFSDAQLALEHFDKNRQPITLQLTVNGEPVAQALLEARATIIDKIEMINRGGVTARDLRTFLDYCSQIFLLVKDFLSDAYLRKILVLNFTRSPDFQRTRLNLDLRQVFETGLNLTILGEAGAGKTTSLQMFAYGLLREKSKNGLVLFSPLAKLTGVRKGPLPDKESKDHEASMLEENIVHYLQAHNINIAGSELAAELTRFGGVLLLDGIDEVIRHSPWIIQGLGELALRFPNVQIVTSCRNTGNYLEDLPFFNLVILPFTPPQKSAFIKQWFSGTLEYPQKIEKHLRDSPHIAEVVSNPLLATILCVLAEHHIPLPNSELRLYEERLKLLLGQYDLHKGVKRISTYSPYLQILARKIAFRLHLGGQREESLSKLYAWASEILGAELEEVECRLALDELIDPCNILIATEEGKIGFGHLRYQEHLAAQEIATNRGVEIFLLMQQEWWRGVFTLYAQMNQDIETIVKQAGFRGALSSIQPTLSEMLEKLPIEQSDKIRKYIDENDSYFRSLLRHDINI